MSEEQQTNVREMLGNYTALARKGARYWRRALVVFVLLFPAGMYWVIHKPRVFRSEASATVHDVGADGVAAMSGEEALAEMRARLDQVYGSRGNLGRVVDEMHLYPWLRGRTSHLKVIEAFQDALTYTAAGRDAFHLQFVYQDPVVAQRTVRRLLSLYSDERRAGGEAVARNDLASVETALAGLETVLGDQEEHLARFEHANHEMVEQVRLRRLGQAFRPGLDSLALAAAPTNGYVPPVVDANDSPRTRQLRIRVAGLVAREGAVQRAISAPSSQTAAVSAANESEHLQTLRRGVAELRERLARLRTTYTEAYPDVQITAQRLAAAERELTAAVATERGRTVASVSLSPEGLRAQLTSIQRDLEGARAALAASLRDDRAHAQSSPTASAPASANANSAVAPGETHAIAPNRGTTRHARHEESAASGTAGAGGNAPVTTNTAAAGVTTPSANPADDPERLGSLVEVESMWDRLTGAAVTTRTRYQQLLTRKFELQATLETMSTSGADVLRVIDPPSLPAEPEPPGRTRLALMILAASIVIALGIAGLSGYIDTRVYEPADLRRWGELPEFPAVPDLRAATAKAPSRRRSAATMRSKT